MKTLYRLFRDGAAEAVAVGIQRFQAKWRSVRVKKTRQIKNLELRFDSIETEKALVWWFRSSLRWRGELVKRTSEPRPH